MPARLPGHGSRETCSRAHIDDELAAGVAVLEDPMGLGDLCERQHLRDLEGVGARAHPVDEVVQPVAAGVQSSTAASANASSAGK